MTFLPIVERELRVAARRSMTFWLRIIAALTAFTIATALLTLFMNIPGGIGAHPGGPLFAVLTWMSLAVVLAAGLFFTSDALSEEKREGTLGFLFLTDLRGYDVVLGKLLATSCRCVFALLAIFPVLACTQLLGGVDVREFWQTILALLHALFFSLTTGIFVSAISRHPQKALAGTLVLLFILSAGGAAVDGFLAFANSKNFSPVLSLVSPVVVFINVGGTFGSFWKTFGASQIMAWMMLGAACWLIPRNWQEKTGRIALAQQSPWRSWWRFGNAKRRTHLRTVVLDQNPLTWLGCRERWQSLWLWLVALVMLGWFLGMNLINNSILDWLSWGFIRAVTMLLLYLWTASQASQVFAELRRGGILELLLASPLDFRKVAPGAWWGMVRLFGIPVAIILLLQFLAVVAQMRGTGSMSRAFAQEDGLIPAWVMLWGSAGCGLLVTVANLVALSWFGLWMGLVSRNGLLATLKTIAFVQIIPWMVIGFASWMVIPMMVAFSGGFGASPGGASWFEWIPIISMILMTLLTLGKDWVFWSLARQRLVADFRNTAIGAIVPASRFLPARPTAPAPPVIAPVTPPPGSSA